jgi:hypothetical protein
MAEKAACRVRSDKIKNGGSRNGLRGLDRDSEGTHFDSLDGGGKKCLI